jgi:preprotein translocase subunit SecY
MAVLARLLYLCMMQLLPPRTATQFTAMDTTISNGVREGGTTAHIFTQCMPYALTLAARQVAALPRA